MTSSYALITGSSTGFGYSLAKNLASRGYNIMLVAIDDEHLKEAEESIKSKYGVDVLSFGIDLSKPESAEKVAHWFYDQNKKLSILVNNVGVGDVSQFDETPLELHMKIVNLNAVLMIKLTHLLLPALKKNNKAYILNVASIASLFPVPYKTIYSATKSFVMTFSFALREEVKPEISVTTTFPPAMFTNDDILRRVNSFGWLARISTLEPDYVAERSLIALFKGKRQKFPGRVNNFLIRTRDLIGYRLTMGIVKNGVKKEIFNNKIAKIKLPILPAKSPGYHIEKK